MTRSFPTRQATAARNREKILAAAAAAFNDPSADVSMAEIARRAGVGMATLYRNFPGRRELLEALYADEVDALCAAAVAKRGQTPGEALTSWLRELFAFLPGKQKIVSELLEHTNADSPIIGGNRARALDAGRPLLSAAQQAHEVRADLTMEQIFDMIIAISTTPGDRAYLNPMLDTMLAGLRSRATE